MSSVADSFKPPCLLGYYPCISNPSSKDCAIMDTCSKDLFFCKFAKLALLMEPIFHASVTVLANRHCTHGGGSCPRRASSRASTFWGTLILVEASDNTANTSSNTCLNSLADKCRGIEARAYHIIDASEVELKPCRNRPNHPFP